MTRAGTPWRNWGRSVQVAPQRIDVPAGLDGVRRAVLTARRRGLTVKAVGAGHSFSPIAEAPGVLIDLQELTGVVRVDRERGRVTLRAGTRLHEIPRLLARYGLAMENLGDIDRQTISGAISTGTHGTGARFRGLAAQVVGVVLVTADGELLRVDQHESPGLLPAVAVGLGALGVLVEITLQCVPAFILHAVDRPAPLAGVLASVGDRAAATDHFEFYWFPHTDVALTKTDTRLPAEAPRRPLPPVGRWIDEELLSNGVYAAACGLGTVAPAVVAPFSRLAVRLTGDREYTDWSHRVLTQHRGVRFREMEYALPAEDVPDAFEALQALIDENGWRISFPVEVRFAAADDLWLSTAHGRATGYIAVHRYWRQDPQAYFEAVEQVMLAHDGRPHWGKMHTLDAAALRPRYPRFDAFVALRDRLDPDRSFTNPYLRRVLGE